MSGQSFEHRKGWLLERMRRLAGVFAVDICAYAVMSNHFHLVVRLGPERAESWDDDEVLRRVEAVFKPTAERLRELPMRARREAVREWRARLSDLSWFMRCLNESIARRANKEDGCTGRFWEGRFKSQALLDGAAVLTCMSYVDLNPVRAGLARRLEDAEFTSIRERLIDAARRARKASRLRGAGATKRRTLRKTQQEQTLAMLSGIAPLVPFARAGGSEVVSRTRKARGDEKASEQERAAIPMSFAAYVDLLEQVGQALRSDGKGTLSPAANSTLERLGIAPERFVETLRGYSSGFFTMVGHTDAIDAERDRLGVRRVKGRSAAVRLYADAA